MHNYGRAELKITRYFDISYATKVNLLTNKFLSEKNQEISLLIVCQKMPNWYWEKKDLRATPSQEKGLDFGTEARYRREGVR